MAFILLAVTFMVMLTSQSCYNCLYLVFIVLGNEMLIYGLIIITMFSTTATGISTAFIMKKLDNIVKLYTQAITNMVVAVVSSIAFPEKFLIDIKFIVCLLLIFIAIFMYETENVSLQCYDHNMNNSCLTSCSLCLCKSNGSSSCSLGCLRRVILLLLFFVSIIFGTYLVFVFTMPSVAAIKSS